METMPGFIAIIDPYVNFQNELDIELNVVNKLGKKNTRLIIHLI